MNNLILVFKPVSSIFGLSSSISLDSSSTVTGLFAYLSISTCILSSSVFGCSLSKIAGIFSLDTVIGSSDGFAVILISVSAAMISVDSS